MSDIVLIKITDKKALRLLRGLEDLKWIEFLKNTKEKKKLSDKYRNVFTEKDSENFKEHTKKMREEWNI